MPALLHPTPRRTRLRGEAGGRHLRRLLVLVPLHRMLRGSVRLARAGRLPALALALVGIAPLVPSVGTVRKPLLGGGARGLRPLARAAPSCTIRWAVLPVGMILTFRAPVMGAVPVPIGEGTWLAKRPHRTVAAPLVRHHLDFHGTLPTLGGMSLPLLAPLPFGCGLGLCTRKSRNFCSRRRLKKLWPASWVDLGGIALRWTRGLWRALWPCICLRSVRG